MTAVADEHAPEVKRDDRSGHCAGNGLQINFMVSALEESVIEDWVLK